MQLSEHDLKQLDEETIRSLEAGTLRTLSVKLLADLKEARDRLNQSPDNSSRPPSSRAPWEGAETEPQDDTEAEGADPQQAGQELEKGEQTNDPATGSEDKKGSEQEQTKPPKKPPGKPGKREGAKGYGRGVELAVTAQHTHRPDECAVCARALAPDAPQKSWTGRYVSGVNYLDRSVTIILTGLSSRCFCLMSPMLSDGCGRPWRVRVREGARRATGRTRTRQGRGGAARGVVVAVRETVNATTITPHGCHPAGAASGPDGTDAADGGVAAASAATRSRASLRR